MTQTPEDRIRELEEALLITRKQLEDSMHNFHRMRNERDEYHSQMLVEKAKAPMNDIGRATFTPEGCFRLPNEQIIPEEQVANIHVSFVKMAKMFASIGYEVPDERDVKLKMALKERLWDSIDKGNLERIAVATEGIQLSLTMLLSVARDFSLVLEEPVRQIKDRKKAEKEAAKNNRRQKKES